MKPNKNLIPRTGTGAGLFAPNGQPIVGDSLDPVPPTASATSVRTPFGFAPVQGGQPGVRGDHPDLVQEPARPAGRGGRR